MLTNLLLHLSLVIIMLELVIDIECITNNQKFTRFVDPNGNRNYLVKFKNKSDNNYTNGLLSQSAALAADNYSNEKTTHVVNYLNYKDEYGLRFDLSKRKQSDELTVENENQNVEESENSGEISNSGEGYLSGYEPNQFYESVENNGGGLGTFQYGNPYGSGYNGYMHEYAINGNGMMHQNGLFGSEIFGNTGMILANQISPETETMTDETPVEPMPENNEMSPQDYGMDDMMNEMIPEDNEMTTVMPSNEPIPSSTLRPEPSTTQTPPTMTEPNSTPSTEENGMTNDQNPTNNNPDNMQVSSTRFIPIASNYPNHNFYRPPIYSYQITRPTNNFINALNGIAQKIKNLFTPHFVIEEAKSQKLNSLSSFLNMFKIFKFDSYPCFTSARPLSQMAGTCYHESDCVNRGGIIAGSCASGFGACCVCEYKIPTITEKISK